MRILLFAVLLITLVEFSWAESWLNLPNEDTDLIDDDNSLSDMSLTADKRRSQGRFRFIPQCMEYYMPCYRNAKRKIGKCCSGMTCKCNLFGHNCRCVDSLWR